MPRFNPDDYIDVQTRINRFWQEYPDGRLDSALVSDPDHFEQVVFRAAVYKHRDDANPSATGWAAEKAGGGGANQTSWHENGETSALGRALANLGYATSQQSRPSREEMGKVNRTSEPQQRPQAPPQMPQKADETPQERRKLNDDDPLSQDAEAKLIDYARRSQVPWDAVEAQARKVLELPPDAPLVLTAKLGRDLWHWIEDEQFARAPR